MIIKNKKLMTFVVWCIVLSVLCGYLWWRYDTTKECLVSAQNELVATQSVLQQTQDNLINAQNALQSEAARFAALDDELAAANQTIADLKSEEYELVYIGEFKITYYCDERRPHICGGNGVTASGKATEVGVTAAADWSVLPNGSVVYIQGIGYREIQDVGGAVDGNHIDVLVNTHDEALSMGLNSSGVWILVKNS